MSVNAYPDEAAIRATLQRQRAANLTGGPFAAEQRIELIDRAIDLLVRYETQLIEALSADFGQRGSTFSRHSDVLSPLATLKQTRAELTGWMQPEPRQVPRGEAWVEYQALGVVGIVTTWNVPVNMVFKGLAGALAAGNRVMLKLSEFTPYTSALMAQMLREAYAEVEVAVITGPAEVGQAFCRQPFDHLMFTGAASIGRQVLRAAAENLVPVTLELGGKSPTIISRSADLKTAVSKIILGKLMNAGQLCVAPDYVFVPEESMDAFVEIARAVVGKVFPILAGNPEYTAVLNERHYQRLQGYLSEARAEGVALIELNPAGETLDPASRLIAPTLLRDPGDSLQVMQDEIFGPVLPIKPYRDFADVIAYINARPRPLGLYWFGSDASEERQVLEHTCSGGVTLNEVMHHAALESLPFGGVGSSGMGAYHGIDGFRTFSHAKAIYRAG